VSEVQRAFRALISALRALRDAASTNDHAMRQRASERFLKAAHELARYVERI
jgi:hypothetical protein